MEGKLNVYYDEEGDFLEINIGEFTKSYCRDIDEGVFERIDEETGQVIGIGILSFKKRTEKLKPIKVSLPVKLKIVA